MDSILHLISQYGYLIIFFGVMAESTGVPLPGETILISAGILVQRGGLDLGDRRAEIGDVEPEGDRSPLMTGDELLDRFRVAGGGDHPVAAGEQGTRELAPEARRTASDEPDGSV